ncbi:hypothetical protein [Sulfurimonas sp.]|uniref:hypothetical protein n=1 Tax=Sulfurimonas sp. TaxID=2022749 RepID=UPI0025D5B297|nr:hypothetical protein [Sulfurimonas sp.]MDD5156847.1 hypothetical protein [Sulfurimonas sp.]
MIKKQLLFILLPFLLFGAPEGETKAKADTKPNIVIKRVGNISQQKKLPETKQETKLTESEQKLNINLLESKSKVCSSLKIAMLLPYKKIGRYASSTTNASLAYLVSKNRPFELKVYKIENESFEEISKAFKKIKDDDFCYVVATLTQEGADVVAKVNPDITVYFPAINKKDATSNSKYLYYGGIDYRAQSDMLLKYAKSPLIIFHDESSVGKKLSFYQEKKNGELYKKSTTTQYLVPEKTTALDKQLSNNRSIHNSSVILNTPIVKSGMIVSQLTLFNTDAVNILSTQTNYNPLLLSMTQYQDIKDMIIANSITQSRDVLIETNALLDNDILYDWINYTTTVGVDFIYNTVYKEDREYDIDVINNQIVYPIELLQPSFTTFKPFISDIKEIQ